MAAGPMLRGDLDVDRPGRHHGLGQLGRRPDCERPTALHDQHAIAQPLGLDEVVRRQDDGPSLVAAEALDQGVDVARRHRIEGGRRLVEEEDVGIVQERPGEREALLHPAAEAAHAVVATVGKAEGFEQARDLVVQPPACHTVETAEECEVLGGTEALVQGGRLGQDACPAANADAVDRRVHPEHLDLAGVTAKHAVEQPDGRRLAGAVVTEQAERLARADLEREPVDGRHRAEPTAKIGRSNRGRRQTVPAAFGHVW